MKKKKKKEVLEGGSYVKVGKRRYRLVNDTIVEKYSLCEWRRDLSVERSLDEILTDFEEISSEHPKGLGDGLGAGRHLKKGRKR